MYKLILADDEPLIRNNMKKGICWNENGYELIGCYSNGAEILEAMEYEIPDVVITDINMPYVNGIEVARQIHGSYPQVKMVFLTGYSEFEYARKAMKYGVSQYLLKPVDRRDIHKTLQEMRERLDQENREADYRERLEEFYQANHIMEDITEKNGPYTKLIEEVKEYVEKRYMDDKFTIEEICEKFYISASHFRAVFKSGTGKAFGSYLREVRMQKARRLLLETNLKNYEVAEMVGYNESGYFGYSFKKYFQVSPNDIRKNR